MGKVSVPKPETREVCTACGQVDGYHLQKCRISELQAEVERLRQIIDVSVDGARKQMLRAEAAEDRAEQAERKLAEVTK